MTTNKYFKNYKIRSYINLAAACIFSILSLSFHADISLLAFPLALAYTGLTVYFTLNMLLKTDGTHIYTVIKFTEYLPYFLFITFILRRAGSTGTSYVYDCITVLLWLVIFVLSYLNSKVLYDKSNEKLVAGWAIPPKKMKFKGWGKLIFEIVDWIDSFVWAIFTVLIFQIFFLQLYKIPSESMVPTFLINDRVFVSKLDCGPKFPLTDVGLPDFRKYKRGDTIVLRNPHYSMDRKSEVKSVTAQLVHMLSLMTININKDENGEMKADPLVKRITGLPGEQLVMQDGVLYVRTKDSDEFIPSEIDAKYAKWNLNTIKNANVKQKVQRFPLSQEEYDKMLDFEEQRRNYDLTVAEYQAKELSEKFRKLIYKENLTGDFKAPSMTEFDLFNNIQSITKNLMSQNGGAAWFENFMTSWIPAKNNQRDYYAESNFKLNVMTKLTAGKLIVRYAELLNQGISATLWASDSELISNFDTAIILNWYIQELLDERNMPLFPSNDSNGNPQYIPENCYFMMGDNRFNSLDLRHANDYSIKELTDQDPLSVQYMSIIAPQYINKKFIIGKPVMRFWPLQRFGKV